MKFVVDANIFFSAFGWGGKPYIIFVRVAKELDTLFITEDIINEIRSTFKKPKVTKYPITQDQIDDIEKLCCKVTVSPNRHAIGVSRDTDDDKYLECASAVGADYIITGDKDLLVLGVYNSVKIVTAAEYLEIVNTPFRRL